MHLKPNHLFLTLIFGLSLAAVFAAPAPLHAAACNFTNTNISMSWAPSSSYDTSGGSGTYAYTPGATVYRSYGDLGLNGQTSRNWTATVNVTNNGVTRTLSPYQCSFASTNNPCYTQTGAQDIGGASFNFYFEVQSYVAARIECTPSSSPDLIGYVGGAASTMINQAITLYGQVGNSGDGTAAASHGMLEICDANCATVHEYRSNPMGSIAPGGATTVSGSYTPTSQTPLYYRVCADWNGGVTESNESNNCSGWQTLTVHPVPTATLTLSPNSIAYGGTSTVSWSSTNATSCTGANFSTGNATSGSVVVSATQSTTYTVYCSGPGGNASDAKTLTVGAQPFPDLVSYIGGTIVTVAGQAGTYGGSTSNIGNATTGAFNDLFIFYEANQSTWNGYVRAARSGALGAGSSANRTASYTFAVPGTRYYRLCADWDVEATESNEGNNCSAFSTVYVRPAPPTGLVHSCNANGTQVTLSWTAPSSGANNYYVRMTGTSTDGHVPTSITYPVTPGQYYDWWVHSNIGAANYDSNRYSDAAYSGFTCSGAADLTAGSVTPTSATAGTAVSLTATASNIGNATSGSFPLLFQVSQNGALFNSSYLAGIAAAGNRSGSASYTFPSAGSYSVRACANFNTAWTAIVTETNYANNCGPWTTVVVAAATPPSVSCTVSPSSVASGGSVTYNANPANGATGPYTWTASDGGSYGSASSVTRVLTAPGIYAMNVRASNSAVSYCPSASVTATWCTNSSTDLSITATPDRVRAGQSVALAWSASGVNGQNASCTVTGPGVSWSSPVSAAPVCSVSGSANPTITTQSTYTLTCGGVSESVTVNVIPNFQEF